MNSTGDATYNRFGFSTVLLKFSENIPRERINNSKKLSILWLGDVGCLIFPTDFRESLPEKAKLGNKVKQKVTRHRPTQVKKVSLLKV